MTLNRIVGRLFGGGKSTAGAPAKVALNPFSAANALVPEAAPARRESVAMVYRDEVFDARTRISGYRFRTASTDASRPLSPVAKIDALKADNLANFAQRRLAVVPVSIDEWQAQDFRQFATSNTIFHVETPALRDDTASWEAGLKDIKASGAKVGVNGALASSGCAAVLNLADAVFVSLADYSLQGFDRTVGSLRSQYPSLAIAADDVHSWPDYRMCVGLGSHYCLGSFATTSNEDDKAETLSQSRLVLIDMLNLLRRDAELAELKEAAKRDPGVSVQVLQMANSPLSGLTAPLASIDQAIMVLGRETLYRWLAVSIFRAGGGRGRDETLLEIALWRARFLELLALGRLPKKESDELFVLGLMSLMDRLLGIPMDEVLAKMPLPTSVADVLLGTQGPYARYFMLGTAIENGHVEWATQLAADLELDTAAVIERNIAARTWAEKALAAS